MKLRAGLSLLVILVFCTENIDCKKRKNLFKQLKKIKKKYADQKLKLEACEKDNTLKDEVIESRVGN